MAMKKNAWDRPLWIAALVGFVIGLIGLVDRLLYGHLHANYGSYVPWGLWIAGYVYLIGLSAGAFVIACLYYVFGWKLFDRVSRPALITAFATMAGAMLLVWLDLGHMGRVWRMALHTNFSSIMGWMFWFYTAYFILLALMLWRAMRREWVAGRSHGGFRGALCRFLSFGQRDVSPETLKKDARALRIMGIIGLPLTIAFYGAEGALFGVVGARSYWHGALMPIMFLAGAFLSGSALVTFISAMTLKERELQQNANLLPLLSKVTLVLLGNYLLLEWAKFTIGLWHAVAADAKILKLVLFGPFWWVFWIIHLGLGVLLPGVLLLSRPNSKGIVSLASFLIFTTFFAVRLNFLIPGLVTPEIQGLEHAYTGPGLRFEYLPGLQEWLVFLWAVSLSALLYLILNNYLAGHKGQLKES